jgi:hypothetical protein
VVVLGGHDPELDGPEQGLRAAVGEEAGQLVEGHLSRRGADERRRQRLLEAEHVAQAAPVLPRLEQLADGGQRVAPAEHGQDEAEAPQVVLAVDAPPPLAPGRREEPALLVQPDVPHGGPGLAGQLVDGPLLRRLARHAANLTRLDCAIA